MQNRHPGKCLTCRAQVAIGAGAVVKIDGSWSCFCAAHAPAHARPATADPTIELRIVDGGRVQIRPAGYLGGELFERYRSAAGGATYDRERRANYATPDLVGAIVTRLAAAGFRLDTDPAVTAAVQAWESRASADTAAADERALAVDARLRERGLALFRFQAEGVSWMAPRAAAILADDMGLGKTIQALTAAPVGAPLLVVAPAVAKGVWAREAARWRPDLAVTVLSGRGSFRWPAVGEMVVVNYDILPPEPMAAKARKALEADIKDARDPRSSTTAAELERMADELLADDTARALIDACPRGVVVVADEAHNLKGGTKTQRGARFRALAEAARERGGRGWLLTATPLLNRPNELWQLLAMVGLHTVVFGSWPNFLRLCGGKRGRFATTFDASAVDPGVAVRLREAMLRRMKVDVLDQLPAKTVEIVEVDLDAQTIKRLDKITAELAEQGIDLAAAIRGAAAHQSVGFEEVARARALLATAKAASAMDMADDLEDAGEPAIVFSAHRAPISVFEAREGWAVITGDTPNEERTAIEERFQRGELKGVAGTIKAMGVAITLTRACHVVFIDAEWTPALNSQAEDRAYRIGQARAVSIRYIKARHAIDERVFELLDIKRGIIARTTDAAATRVGELAARVNAAEALERARVSTDAAQRQREGNELIERVRAERAAVVADAARREVLCKSENANRNRGWSIDPLLFQTPARPARADSPTELWAAASILHLAAHDGDFARDENGVGFSQADTHLGHVLALTIAGAGALNEGEWRVAINLACRYPGQVGRPEDSPD